MSRVRKAIEQERELAALLDKVVFVGDEKDRRLGMEKLKTLIMLVGLPRSGKTTWALEHGAPIVNPDAIRLAIHGNAYIQDAEKFVWATAHYMVKALFLAGHDTVILDACNNTRKRRKEWKSYDEKWERKFVVIKTDPDICLSRINPDDPNADGLRAAIQRMASQHEPVDEDEEGNVIHASYTGTSQGPA